ncbi:hypothetical protein O6H91_01G159600 [Diphasiastrum complanatum]|uniref:Uncharacterized protein n=1 Tax=Diphasiastrum complanatum TaxID=34168 RepID=A0ACC2EXX3_DIPCM|nr:hypothetical protein O6H91_01G159600 [Diphasiastrum complanatum]
MPFTSFFEASQYYNLPSTALDAPTPAQEPLASLNSASKWLLNSKNQAAEIPSFMKRDDQSCAGTTKFSCDLARYDSAPSSFLSSFADLRNDGMPHMSRLSNEGSSLNAMLPELFCAGTVAALVSNNALQMEVDGLSRPSLEDHKQFSAESRRNRRLSAQNSRSHEEARPSFVANLDHRALAATDYTCEFGAANGHISSHQQRNQPSPEGNIHIIPAKGTKTPMRKDGILKSSPMGVKSNVLRHRSSPASLENDDVIGFSEEAALSSLSEVPDIGGRGLAEDSKSHEGSLMSILEGASMRKRVRDLDAFHMNNVSSPSDLQDGSGGQTTSLTRHVSLPVPLKSKDDVPVEDNWLQDSVPCRFRAKRGCATHPRSIAERVFEGLALVSACENYKNWSPIWTSNRTLQKCWMKCLIT